MPSIDGERTFADLRKRHPRLTYVSAKWAWLGSKTLTMDFEYRLENGPRFQPKASLEIPVGLSACSVPPATLDWLVFQFGMVQLISYWKCACPPEIIIGAGSLTDWQIAWWRKLIFRGLGEFFFVNRIPADPASLLTINCARGAGESPEVSFPKSERLMIPVGGGKDSAVTLDILADGTAATFVINPIPAAVACVRQVEPGLERMIQMNYAIDPQLLALNQAGYLNGHTPFSALVAFATALAGALTGCSSVALSNEASASEGNTTYHGFSVNHQYSKSLEFENDFRQYCQRSPLRGFDYFSFLRPLNELQIARLFAQRPQFFDSFNSCNRGGRSGQWCRRCPKCLFSWMILAPFVGVDRLRGVIGEDLFAVEELGETFDALVGLSPVKPLDCVGTEREVRYALSLVLEKAYPDRTFPLLLQRYQAELSQNREEEDLLEHFAAHNVTEFYLSRLEKATIDSGPVSH